jgi:hypothetical protein
LLADHLLTTSTVVMSVVDPDRLLGEFQRGATAAFQRIDDFLPAAAALAAELTELVGHPVRGNVYLTPPRSPTG